MRKFLYILAIAFVCLGSSTILTSCDKEDDEFDEFYFDPEDSTWRPPGSSLR